MKIINLSNDIEDLFMSKMSIEKYLIDQKTIEAKMSINEFITWLNMASTIFMYNVSNNIEAIPFSIIDTDDEMYLFITESKQEYVDALLVALADIEYNTGNLIRITNYDIFNDKLDGKSYFYINQSVYLSKNQAEAE